MFELLWLLLPLAAGSGWYFAHRSYRKQVASNGIPSECIRGLNYLLSEQQDKALEIFTGMIEADEGTIEPHFVLAQMFRRRGEVDRAIKIHQNLLARPNLNVTNKNKALLELGKDYLKAGLLDRAEGLFSQVIDESARSAEAYQHLLEVYEQEKDWESAIQAAIKCQNQTGESQAGIIAHYYCEIGEADARTNDRASASRMARQALQYDSNCVRASILLGDMAFEDGHYGTAIEHFTNVHSQEPTFLSVALPRLKASFERANDRDGYIRFLQEIRKDDRGVSSMLSLIDSLAGQGDHKAAQEIFDAELQRPNVSLRLVRQYVEMTASTREAAEQATIEKVIGALDSHLDSQASHQCVRCGFETRGLFWCCPGCRGWGTIKPADKLTELHSRQAHYTV